MSIVYSWRDLVIRANPDHVRESRYAVEYEFTAPGGYHEGPNGEKTHEHGMRVFRGYYDERGPYRSVPAEDNAITFGGVPLAVDGQNLTVNEE